MDLLTTWKGRGPDRDGTDAGEIILGDNRANVLRGFGGDDHIDGGNRDDRIEGGDGSDTIIGGAGADTMSGGDGADEFVFKVRSHTTNDADQTDVITDFSPDDFLNFAGVSNGDGATSFSQFSFTPVDGGTMMDVDLGGLDSNDMHILLLGAHIPTEDQIIFGAG